MLNPGLSINKAFREKVESNMDLRFISKKMITIIRVLIKKNTCVFSILIFDENTNNTILKVLSSIVCLIIKNHVCADYLCCLQNKLHDANKIFEKQHTMIFQELQFLN